MTHAIIAANGRAELKSASSSTMWAVLPPNSKSVFFTVGASDDDSYQISTRTMLRNNLTLDSIVMLDCRGVLDAAPRRPRPPRPGADTCDKYIPIYQGEDFVRVWQEQSNSSTSVKNHPRGSTTSPSGSPTCAPTTSEAQGCAPNAPAPHVYSRIAVTYIVDPKHSVSSPDSDRV